MIAHVIMVMLSLLCLTESQTVGAQNLNMRRKVSSSSSSAANVSSSQKPVMPLQTKSTGNAVSISGTEYATWADAVAAINNSSESNFDIILLNDVMDAKTMPSKPCTISGTTANINFAYIDDNSYLTRIQMSAPVTFKNITLRIWQIAANGHALTFDEGVTVLSTYQTGNEEIGYTTHTGIRNIWGGTDNNNDVENTNITIKSGQFGWVTGGSTTLENEPANSGDVTGTSTVTITGGTINGAIFGGGYAGTCGNTIVNMSGGTTGWIYGGGEIGNITGTAQLTISGETTMINHNLFGGSDSGTCGSTEVILNGGTFKENIFAGGYLGIVTGLSSIVVNGAKIDPDELGGGSYSGGCIYGGGFGQEGNNEDKGKVGSTKVVIKGIAPNSKNVTVQGGGLHSKVTGNTDVTIEGGNINNVYASGYNYNTTTGSVGGNVNLLIKGGTIDVVGAARGQDQNAAIPVSGTMNITIEGGVVNNFIRSGNESHGSEYKACTLTVKNLGSENNPYTLPGIYAVSNLVLENSIVKFKEPEFVVPFVYNLYGFTVMEDHPINISGNGKLAGTNIFIHALSPSTLSPNKPVVIAENLPATTTFAGYVKIENNNPVTIPIYKAGHTYRLKKNEETLYTVGIATPETEGIGSISVKWDQYATTDVMLEDGDQVPNTASITPTATPNDEGIIATLKNGETTITSGSPLTLSANASFHGEFEILPLDLNGKNADITISKESDIWKYTKEIVTKAPATPISFNGIIQNTLANTKRVMIDATAQGTLTFENAKINSTTTAAPALTIASGAKVSFKGNLEVKTGEADQYGIVNNGNLTITGASTEITATNTTSDSDKGIKVNTAASIVSETDTKLITSGVANTGTVVVKDGAIAETSTGAALQKTYLVTITDPGNGNKLTLTAGTDITVSDQDKVADKTVLTVSGVPASGYTLESITVTPKGGQTVTLSNNSTYTMPESEVTFAAIFKGTTPPTPPATVYYNVTLPAVEGVTTDPAAGEYEVEAWGSFRFYLTLDKGYDQSEPVVTTDRGETITPRSSDGAYIVKYIRTDMEIFIDGIVKNPAPVANEKIETNHPKVWKTGNQLHIQAVTDEPGYIYTPDGKLQTVCHLIAGEVETVRLPDGIYFVRVGKERFKIVL